MFSHRRIMINITNLLPLRCCGFKGRQRWHKVSDSKIPTSKYYNQTKRSRIQEDMSNSACPLSLIRQTWDLFSSRGHTSRPKERHKHKENLNPQLWLWCLFFWKWTFSAPMSHHLEVFSGSCRIIWKGAWLKRPKMNSVWVKWYGQKVVHTFCFCSDNMSISQKLDFIANINFTFL